MSIPKSKIFLGQNKIFLKSILTLNQKCNNIQFRLNSQTKKRSIANTNGPTWKEKKEIALKGQNK